MAGDGPQDTLERLRAAYDQARAEVTAAADPHLAYHLATRLAELLGPIAEDCADLRAEAVGRIWQREALSLRGLGDRIGVSKARAAQLKARSGAIRRTTRQETPCADS